MLTLDVKAREANVSLENLRASGFVPAVFYGPKEASTAIAIAEKELEHVWKEAGQTSVVALRGGGVAKEALIYDVQTHPVTGRVLHADFYVLEKGKKIRIAVPLEFIGHAPAEKTGHIVVKALHEIEIEVLPAQLPHALSADLSSLENVGDHILASQIPLPPSATLITPPGETVASITAFKEEKVEEPAAFVPAEVIGAAPAASEAPEPAEGPGKTEKNDGK